MQFPTDKVNRTACFLLIAIAGYMLTVRGLLIFSYSLNLEGAEFSFIHQVQLLLDGKPLYRDPGVFPYFPVLYMPLHPYLMYFICKLFGLSAAADIHTIYIIGRTLSFITVLATAWVLDRFITLFNKNALLRIFSFTLFLSLLSAHIYTVRPDALQLLFFTLYLFFLVKYIFHGAGTKWLTGAMLFALLTVFSRQDSVILIFMSLFLLLVYERSMRATIIFAVFTLMLGASLAGAYFLFGSFFFLNTVIYNVQVIKDLDKLLYVKLFVFILLRLLPLVIVAAYVVYTEIINNRKKNVELFLAGFALFYFIITHLMMLRAGSHINYVQPVVVLLVISLSVFSAYKLPLLQTHRPWVLAAVAAYVGWIAFSDVLINSYSYKPSIEALNKHNYFSALQERDEILNITQNDTLFFLNAKYVLQFQDKPVIFGYDNHVDRLIEILTGFKFKSKLSFVSPDKYDGLFENGNVQYIVAENNSVSQQQVKKYYTHFHFLKQTGIFNLYKYDRSVYPN